MKKAERHIVLNAPDVHWNTGNIGRTCIGTDTFLHLIKPLGFSIGDREVKRAGLDYWHKVKLKVWESFEDFTDELNPDVNEISLFTKNGSRSFRQMDISERMFLIFGSETKGLPETILNIYKNRDFHIPITQNIRSLNLSTSVGIALYESLRGFDDSIHGWE